MATSNNYANFILGSQPFVGVGGPWVMSNGNLFSSADGQQACYRYCNLALTPVATPTDVIVIQGSATKTIRIRKLALSGVATAAGNMPIQLVRRSTAGTLGSAVLTAVTAAQCDINNVAPTAVVSTVGTANYTTLGTSAGVIGAGRLGFSASGTGLAANFFLEDTGASEIKAIVLRGTSDYLCINFTGAAVPSGGVIDFEIVTEEDAS